VVVKLQDRGHAARPGPPKLYFKLSYVIHSVLTLELGTAVIIQMEPDAVGLRCDSTSCNQFDFLPIKCHCNKVFCSDHISPDKHSCSSLDRQAEGQTAPSVKRQRCALGNCQKLSLQSATSSDSADLEINTPSTAACQKCSLSFCVE